MRNVRNCILPQRADLLIRAVSYVLQSRERRTRAVVEYIFPPSRPNY